jgi:hypothetical protein
MREARLQLEPCLRLRDGFAAGKMEAVAAGG